MKLLLLRMGLLILPSLMFNPKIYSQGDIWPAAIVEMHYNNTGPDVNEYIEIHQQSFNFPDPNLFFDQVEFYDDLGNLYKTLPRASMQVFSIPSGDPTVWGHDFNYYQFTALESFADAGTVKLINNFAGRTVLADYVYNAAGITENRYVPAVTSRTFPIVESEAVPIGSSLNFCGYYYGLWTSAIMANSYGALNSCVILPLRLISFNYSLVNEKVQLSWQTASETNTDRFEVEKSTDGVNFSSIGTVRSAGTSNTPKDYDLPDPNPSAINYYRVKQVDQDGKYSYSKILLVKLKSGNPLTIQPTIVADKLTINISLSQQDIRGIYIYDLSGRAIMSFAGKSGYNEINVSNFSAGTYLIRLQTTNAEVYSQRFVKQ